ncbi:MULTISPECIES: branched-chain amino acid ABC transporter permease [unclassified Minwuia]|jgi:branched-chain amino acid transport system permease protein|uniref:branched-chain amino acid ABC transporter permease n=1 Tax=unclassified Minwuia TaxID=2618799 RepID=UPI00247B0CE2|nr:MULTISPECIES: branched-chain amino acid ABC transporter permease [unclassified Minwuia]MDF1730081.1 branched-chain amino acid ABC transporter permease [Minwuia sp.]MDF1736782.1 branched-chain amino acid ABC transporter permease [Minwuia sp.]
MAFALQVLMNALSLGSLYALAALGIGLLFGVLKLINFAHGDFITVGAYALIVPSAATQATLLIGDFHPLILIPCIVVVVVILALIAEFLVFRPLRNASPATLMIGSFALGFVIQNILIMIYGGRPKAVGIWSDLSLGVELMPGVEVPKLQLIIIGVTLVLMVVLVLFLTKTKYGVHMRAAAEDFRMARMLGIEANRVIMLAVAISGMLAAAVSMLFVVQTGILDFRMGVSLMLFAFIATVIGGMGSLVGAVVGGFAVGAVSILLQTFLPSEMRVFRDVFVFAIVIFILLVRPQGLVMSRASRERV